MRKLFCEISPLTYRISVCKCRLLRHIRDAWMHPHFAREQCAEPLPVLIYKHTSLIRRKLGNTQMDLQENKAVNLALSTPHVNGVLIRPGETFSFWHLVGNPTAAKGYREGVTINNWRVESGIGGGMCQFTNLLHWMILHTPLTITEHHHHDGLDLFPDFGRQVPFGTGTSILYNYVDYRFKNETDMTWQIVVYVTDTHLCGELRAERALPFKYHIQTENERFVRTADGVYRKGEIYRSRIDKRTGNVLDRELIKANHAKVMYDSSGLTIAEEAECS